MKFYTPVEASETAYLLEAALWVALGRVPEFMSDFDGNDVRGDFDKQDDFYSPLELGLFSEQEFVAAGQVIDFERYFNAAVFDPGFRDQESMLAHFEVLSSVLVHKERPSKRDMEEIAYVDQCTSCFRPLIERAKVKILDDLMTGKLVATGLLATRSPDPDYPAIDNIDTEKKSIPQTAWNIDGLDWCESTLIDWESEYLLVYLKFADLIGRFPTPLIGNMPLSGDKFGETICVASDKPQGLTPLNRGRGRPPKAAGSIRSVVRNVFREKIRLGDVPDKNEALYQEVIEFVRTAFGEEVSRSTAQSYVRDMLSNTNRRSAGN